MALGLSTDGYGDMLGALLEVRENLNGIFVKESLKYNFVNSIL